MKLFLDTNVLVDYLAAREPHLALFKKLLAMRLFGDAELWCSAKSFTDVFYIASRYVDPVELQRAFVTSAEFLDICSVDGNDVVAAAKEEWDDFEDCLVSRCADKVKADYLVTRDEDGFRDAKVRPVHPRDLLERIRKDFGIEYEEIGF